MIGGEIPYTAREFSQWPPLTPSQHRTGSERVGHMLVSPSELAAHATTVGDVSVLAGGPSRPSLELKWRTAMVLSAVTPRAGHWRRTDSYSRLDGSEKSAVSYFLGEVLASVASAKLLNAPCVVHVDAALRELGVPLSRRKRPDLVGYQIGATITPGAGRLLIEAKGRSGWYARRPVESALLQVKSAASPASNLVGPHALRVAFLAYFEPPTKGAAPVWCSHLEDPPPDESATSELGDFEFRGLVELARYRPLVDAINESFERSGSQASERSGDFIYASLPELAIVVAVPYPIFEAVVAAEYPATPQSLARFFEVVLQCSDLEPPAWVGDEVLDAEYGVSTLYQRDRLVVQVNWPRYD